MQPSERTTTSFGRLSRRPRKLLATTVMLPSASWRVTRRLSCSQATSRPCRSRVRPLGAIGRFEKQRNAASRLVLHATVVVDVAEQEVAAVLTPQRSLGRALRPAEAICEVLDRLRGRNGLLELRRELLDARRQVVVGHGEPSHRLYRPQTLGLRRTPSKGPVMEFGASIFFTDYSITPAELAVALE